MFEEKDRMYKEIEENEFKEKMAPAKIKKERVLPDQINMHKIEVDEARMKKLS